MSRHPLPVAGPLEFRPADGAWRSTIEMAPLAEGMLLVPSFAAVGAALEFQFVLAAEEARWELQAVGNATQPTVSTDGRARVAVDLVDLAADLDDARLELTVNAAAPPERYLATVTARPRHIEASAGSAVAPPLAVPALSQMTAPEAIRRRICSPACLAMVLSYHGIEIDARTAASAVHDPVTQMYGVWPLNLALAARHGCIGAMEAFSSLDEAAVLLARGLPLVASIRFDAGGLPGAPLERTGGHLVVLTGMDEELVYVNDPAAPADGEVRRRYPRRAFARAWLAERGVAYLVLPPCG